MQIAHLLKKYALLIPRERRVKNALVKALFDVVGLEIPDDKITVSSSRVLIDASPIIKSKIHMHRDQIIARATELDPKLTHLDLA